MRISLRLSWRLAQWYFIRTAPAKHMQPHRCVDSQLCKRTLHRSPSHYRSSHSRIKKAHHLGIRDNTFSWPELVYVPDADHEDLENYTADGFHPVRIGDRFEDGQYQIVHKLGFGGSSTIWLARDHLSQRYVSLKILLASETPKSVEADIMHRLNTHPDPGHLGLQFIPFLLDKFSILGPNGNHICLVQEPAECSVADSKEVSGSSMFPKDTARSIAAQLIVGLSYLHSKGICHGGKFIFFCILSDTYQEIIRSAFENCTSARSCSREDRSR